MQTLSEWLARLCIWVVGLPSVSLEVRRAEAAKAARPAATVVNESIETRGIGFGEYLLPECDCDCGGDEDQEGHR